MIKVKFRDINKNIAFSGQYIGISNINIIFELSIFCFCLQYQCYMIFIPSEARVVRLSQNSDDYKRQVRQLHANIQSLGNVLKFYYAKVTAIHI